MSRAEKRPTLLHPDVDVEPAVLGDGLTGLEPPLSGVLLLALLALAVLRPEVGVSALAGSCRSARIDGSAFSFTLPLTPVVSVLGGSTGAGLLQV